MKFDPVVSKISGDNHKKPLDNYIIDMSKYLIYLLDNNNLQSQSNEDTRAKKQKSDEDEDPTPP